MERSFLDDSGAVAVFADQLEEQGDPRAELVRAQLAGDAARAKDLIAHHWAAWLGALSPDEVLLTWKRGCVLDAALRSVPAGWRLEDLLSRPAFHFLERLAIGHHARVELTGLELPRMLRTLVWFTGAKDSLQRLAVGAPTSLESFTLEVNADEVDGLSALKLPILKHLHTGCTAANETALLRELARATWWATVTRWTHRTQSTDGLQALLACQPLVDRRGRGFVALCPKPVLSSLPPALRHALPLAEFRLLPAPPRPRDPEDSNGPALLSVTPLEGRMDFRALPGWVTTSRRSIQNVDGTDTTRDGPGEPFARSHDFSSCAWCGGSDTRLIHSQDWSLYSHFETTSFRRWEYECVECRLFTHMRSAYTH